MGQAIDKIKTMSSVNTYHNEQEKIDISVDFVSAANLIESINTSFDSIKSILKQTMDFDNQMFKGNSAEGIIEFKGWVQKYHEDLDMTLKEYQAMLKALRSCESEISSDLRRSRWINQ